MTLQRDKIFNLHSISERMVSKNVILALTDDEQIIGCFMSVRDQVVFTNKRLISVDVHGVTGAQQDIIFMPYKHIQYFEIKTSGLGEFIPNSRLQLFFADGGNISFNFQEKVNALEIVKSISKYCI